MGALYRGFFVSIVRAAIAAACGWLVSRGLVEHSVVSEISSVTAFLIVDRAWEFYLLHRAELYQRWLITLGLNTSATNNPDTIAAIKSDAQYFVKEGLRPHGD